MTKKRKNIIFIVAALVSLIIFYSLSKRNTGSIEFEDSNKNGLWDDIEPFIQKTAKTDSQKKVLSQKFKAYQKVLLDPDIGKSVRQGSIVDDELARSSACLQNVWKKETKKNFDHSLAKDALLNSKERLIAWIKYNSNLSGGTFELWNEEKHGDPCNMKPGDSANEN